jgi:3-methyl-2-oxobutanoate hydroxymethyltransferase
MRFTLRDIQKMKTDGKKIAVLTAYDATSARVAEAADVPMILVGDSLGMVVQGHPTPLPVTLEQMIYHAEIVVRVTKKPLVVVDLPFMTYQVSEEQALQNAARVMQATGATAVKIEGGVSIAPTIARLVSAGIPVMAHIGLTPQSLHQFGGFRVQGRDLATARQLVRDAEAVQSAGAFAVVLELVPAELAQVVTERLHIPTIGIGAGAHCSGQVQVFHDILALFSDFLPKHAKPFAQIGQAMQDAVAQYRQEVEGGAFPTASNASKMDESTLQALKDALRDADTTDA